MVESPCINECKLDQNLMLCLGCFRNADEITKWIYLNDDQKKEVIKKAKKRKTDFKERNFK